LPPVAAVAKSIVSNNGDRGPGIKNPAARRRPGTTARAPGTATAAEHLEQIVETPISLALGWYFQPEPLRRAGRLRVARPLDAVSSIRRDRSAAR